MISGYVYKPTVIYPQSLAFRQAPRSGAAESTSTKRIKINKRSQVFKLLNKKNKEEYYD